MAGRWCGCGGRLRWAAAVESRAGPAGMWGGAGGEMVCDARGGVVARGGRWRGGHASGACADPGGRGSGGVTRQRGRWQLGFWK